MAGWYYLIDRKDGHPCCGVRTMAEARTRRDALLRITGADYSIQYDWRDWDNFPWKKGGQAENE